MSAHPDHDAAAAQVRPGAGARVVPVPWVAQAGAGREWHSMTVYLDSSGLEVSRQEQSGVGGQGGHGVTWRHVAGDGAAVWVRLDVWGPDRGWCIDATRRAWAALTAS